MVGIIKKEIQGNFIKYAELTAELGYCFFDVDVPAEERIYMTHITTPITDDSELERKFNAVQGNADELNEQLAKEKEKENQGVNYGETNTRF